MKACGLQYPDRESQPSMFNLMQWEKPQSRVSETKAQFQIKPLTITEPKVEQKQKLTKEDILNLILKSHQEQTSNRKVQKAPQKSELKTEDEPIQSQEPSIIQKEEKIDEKKLKKQKSVNEKPRFGTSRPQSAKDPKIQENLNLLQSNIKKQNIKQQQKIKAQENGKQQLTRKQSVDEDPAYKELQDPKWNRVQFIQELKDKKAKANQLPEKINSSNVGDFKDSQTFKDFNLQELNPKNYRQNFKKDIFKMHRIGLKGSHRQENLR